MAATATKGGRAAGNIATPAQARRELGTLRRTNAKFREECISHADSMDQRILALETALGEWPANGGAAVRGNRSG